MTIPEPAPRAIRVWGHPASVEGYMELKDDDTGARLLANFIPSHRWIEMRMVFPRSQLVANPGGAKIEDGDGLPAILREERALAIATNRDRERIAWARSNAPLLLLALLLLAVGACCPPRLPGLPALRQGAARTSGPDVHPRAPER